MALMAQEDTSTAATGSGSEKGARTGIYLDLGCGRYKVPGTIQEDQRGCIPG